MPVLSLVASTIVVRPGSILPSASAASIIATPIRSLTLPPGLKDSSFANSRTPASDAAPSSMAAISTRGVFPTSSSMLIGIRPIGVRHDNNGAVWRREVLRRARRFELGLLAPLQSHARRLCPGRGGRKAEHDEARTHFSVPGRKQGAAG